MDGIIVPLRVHGSLRIDPETPGAKRRSQIERLLLVPSVALRGPTRPSNRWGIMIGLTPAAENFNDAESGFIPRHPAQAGDY